MTNKNKIVELKKLQKRRDFLYKISNQYLDKLFVGNLSYIDYLNMEELKKEIKLLNKKGNEITKKIVNG